MTKKRPPGMYSDVLRFLTILVVPWTGYARVTPGAGFVNNKSKQHTYTRGVPVFLKTKSKAKNKPQRAEAKSFFLHKSRLQSHFAAVNGGVFWC